MSAEIENSNYTHRIENDSEHAPTTTNEDADTEIKLQIEALTEAIRLNKISKTTAEETYRQWSSSPDNEQTGKEMRDTIRRIESTITGNQLTIELLTAKATSAEEEDVVIEKFIASQMVRRRYGHIYDHLERKEAQRQQLENTLVTSEMPEDANKDSIRELVYLNESIADIKAQVEEIERDGLTDEEIPRVVSNDINFDSCLFEADSAKQNNEIPGQSTYSKALELFTERFPSKRAYYDRIKAAALENGEILEKMTDGEKVAFYLTGMTFDDPDFADRLITDKEIIRAKYKLPPLEMRRAVPTEYEAALMKLITETGAEFRDRSEMGGFFNENPMARGFYNDDEGIISTQIDRSTADTYDQSLRTVEHELIHALQHKYSPRMPIELMEYEAYLGANFNPGYLKDDPDVEEALDFMFGSMSGITGSVNWWYTHQSTVRGETVVAPWEELEYPTPPKNS